MKPVLATRVAVVAAVLLTCFAIAGCGTSSAPAPQTSPPAGSATTGSGSSSAPPSTAAAPSGSSANGADSMTILTQAEVSAAIGQTVKPPVQGKATVEGGVAAVFYGPSAPAGADPDVPVPDSVRVVLVRGPNAKMWYDDYRKKVRAVAVPGLGDEAYYDGYASLSVLKGDAYIRIAVAGPRGIDLAAEKKLAADALPRM